MRFSIIIPVYNVAEYLQGCIDSVLANDCCDAEIILVDDGSTDGICPQLCDEIACRYPNLIRVIHQKNQGLGGARNTGIEAAEGEYLLFVDSDDTIASNTLKILSEAVERTHAEICSFAMYSHDGEGHKSRMETSAQIEGVFSLHEHPEFLLSLPAAWARLWKRELFLRSGIRYPSRVWYEDIRTSTKLFAEAASIVTLPDPLYYYLQRPGSIMNSGKTVRNAEILDAFDDILNWFRAKHPDGCYGQELERLAIDHVLLAASVRVARVDPKAPVLREFETYMDRRFPAYRQNSYLSQLPRSHKLLLRLLEKKQYTAINWLFRIKDRISR